MHALKYRGFTKVVKKLMVPLMFPMIERRFNAVVPVPLHRSRLRRRGFNQAELMAKALAQKIGAPASDKLQVVRRTRDQVELSGAGRRANVAGAFAARGWIGGRVLLIDDVFTTGATLSECAGALKRAGANEVHALSFCRTV